MNLVGFKLLCTFAFRNNIKKVLDDVSTNFKSVPRIFVFYNKDSRNECYVTFNIDTKINPKFDHYIAIHRKKETNTLYSVNALNIIIEGLNNGILDKKFIIDWNRYANMLLLTNEGEVSRIHLELDKVYRAN